MNFFVWSTIILAVWAAVGPLVGVRYGSLLAERVQREHWVSDNKKQEYRELLTAMSRAEKLLIHNHAFRSGEDEKENEEAEIEAFTVIQDRIFIATVMDREKVAERWAYMLRHYHEERSLPDFMATSKELRGSIMKAASKELGIAWHHLAA